MPRTLLVKTTALGPDSSLYTAGAADVTMAAGDLANGNYAVMTGRDLIIARNSDAVNPYTVTIASVADPTYHRTGDITAYSLAAGDVVVFGPFNTPGWMQTTGYLHVNVSNAAIILGHVALPSV